MLEHLPITVITCWEGQVVETVTTWLATEREREVAYLITAGAPEKLLAEPTGSASQRLREHLDYALANEQHQEVFLVGHAHCTESGEDTHQSVATFFPRALARLRDLCPQCTITGMWLDETGQLRMVEPRPAPAG